MTSARLLASLPAAVLVAFSPGANNPLALTNGARSALGRTVASLSGRLLAFAPPIVAVAPGDDGKGGG